MIDIDWIRKSIISKKYYLSNHADSERMKDNLLLTELKESIQNGIIIEQYDDSGRGKSCLVAGYTLAGKPVHSVVGKRSDEVVFITVYIPTPPKFKSIYERG